MSQTSPSSTRLRVEAGLMGRSRDFSASFMDVQYIGRHVADFPLTTTSQTLSVLFCVLESCRFDSQKQIYFLYHEAALTLVNMAQTRECPFNRTILPKLESLMLKSSGQRLKAISQAIGTLKLPLPKPENLKIPENIDPIEIPLETLVKKFGLLNGQSGKSFHWEWKGRSLMARTKTEICGVIKFATSSKNIRDLYKEALWMNRLNETPLYSQCLVPVPVNIERQYIFTVKDPLPQGSPDTLLGAACMAFIPCPGYYDYPNQKGSTPDQAKAAFFKSAEILGLLSSHGIFHTALIPLFHNRVQQARRNDNGRYLWEHAGRLDQWLDSSMFPNFAASGLRDFEHMVQKADLKDLGHYTGEYLLSFILSAGAFFRNKAPHRRGKNDQQPHVDTRDLFSKILFQDFVTGICQHYFKGLTGFDLCDIPLFNIPLLIDRLIERMGSDEHMEEVLRVRDQLDMNDEQFEKYLRAKGVGQIPVRGENEIVLFTGPHLGGFNQAISIPDVIDFLFKFSACCVSSCFTPHGLQDSA